MLSVAGLAALTLSLPGVSAQAATSFHLGVAGLVFNKNGSITLWVMNTTPKTGPLADTITSVFLNPAKGHPISSIKALSGNKCVFPMFGGTGGAFETKGLNCFPVKIAPGQAEPVVTFSTTPPYPKCNASARRTSDAASDCSAQITEDSAGATTKPLPKACIAVYNTEPPTVILSGLHALACR